MCASSTLQQVSSSCTTVTLPNIMDLRSCLVVPDDLCSTPDRITDFTESLISCAVEAIQDIDEPSQLFLMEGLITPILERIGLGPIVKAIFGICKAIGGAMDTLENLSFGVLGLVMEPTKDVVSGILPLPDCSANSIRGTVSCNEPITLSIPASTGVEKCFNYVKSSCNKKKVNKGPVVVDLFKTISCLTSKVFDMSQPEGIASLGCSVVTGWAKGTTVGRPAINIDLTSILPGGSLISNLLPKPPKPQDDNEGIISSVIGGILPHPSDSSSDKPGGIVGSVMDTIGGILPHPSDSSSDKPGGLVGSVVDTIGGILPHPSDSSSDKPGGLVGSVVDTIGGILPHPPDPTSDKPGGLVGSVMDTIGGILPQPSDSSSDKPGGLVGSVMDTIGGILPRPPDSSSDKPGGLLSIVPDVLSPSSQDSDKPKGLLSSIADTLTPSLPSLTPNKGTDQDGGDSTAKDSSKPSGLIGGVLDVLTPSQPKKESDAEAADSTSKDSSKPSGLLGGVLDILTPDSKSSSSDGDTDASSKDKKKPQGLLSSVAGALNL